MLWLRSGYKKRSIDRLIMTLPTALKVENREGKPTVNTDNPQSARIDAVPTVDNLLVSPPRILLVDATVVGNDVIVGLDSRVAIRRMINTLANYQATQEFVLTRSRVMRFDTGETSYKIYNDAWSQLTIDA